MLVFLQDKAGRARKELFEMGPSFDAFTTMPDEQVYIGKKFSCVVEGHRFEEDFEVYKIVKDFDYRGNDAAFARHTK